MVAVLGLYENEGCSNPNFRNLDLDRFVQEGFASVQG